MKSDLLGFIQKKLSEGNCEKCGIKRESAMYSALMGTSCNPRLCLTCMKALRELILSNETKYPNKDSITNSNDSSKEFMGYN